MGSGNEKNAALSARYEKQAAAFFAKVDGPGRAADALFACPGDEPLTAEERAAIDEYWGKYAFAYPHIDYDSFRTFKNRWGRFDVRHCPGSVHQHYFRQHEANAAYTVPFGNKTLMEYFYPDLPQPATLFRRMDGYCYDGQFQPVTLPELAEACARRLEDGEDLVLKPGFSSGGRGVRLLTRADADPAAVRAAVAKGFPGQQAFVVQRAVRQSPFMAALNPSSVNVLRVTTLVRGGVPVPLAALLRVGAPGAVTCGFRPGGAVIGVDLATGRCQDWALRGDMQRVTELPGGARLGEGLTVPRFGRILDMAAAAHCRIPYLRLLSWDVALDEKDGPVFIKCTPKGEIQLHEAVTGPLFGPYMDELLDQYLGERFFIRFAHEGWVCREYGDRVEAETAPDPRAARRLPDTLRGKPVVRAEAAPKKTRRKRLESIRFLRRVLKGRAYDMAMRVLTEWNRRKKSRSPASR